MGEKAKTRKIVYYRHYYLDFFDKQSYNVQLKLNWTLRLVSELDRIPSKYFKHVEGSGGIYEIRAEVESNIFRVFCFFDEGNMIVIGNAFQKKTQKVPLSEIETAKRIKRQYEKEK